MKISINTIKELTGLELPPINKLVDVINRQLGGVEDVIPIGEIYKDAIIVRVVSCEKHPDADRLSVCLVDDNGARADVERTSDGFIRVVCGAPNVAADMLAVWLPPGSTVPASYTDKEPFVLTKREIRGIVSNGMLAAGDELAINSDHDGIVSLTEADLPQGKSLQVGASFAETFDLNDTIIDIENKMFTHRPDLFGQLGVAREIFAILQPTPNPDEQSAVSFKNDDWYAVCHEAISAEGLRLEVFNEAHELAPRFMAVAVKDVEVKPSPLWLQTTLMRWGGKAINNIVDLTNYIMLLTAQPTHAYDYDKLRGNKLGVRAAKAGESVVLLNGKSYELDETDIVIVDGEGPVGLAGIMGGGNSEVSASTKNIVLEVANFDMYAVRRSAMRHGLFTDALTRFNKGQSPLQNDRVLARLLELMPGEQASDIYDLTPLDTNLEVSSESIHPSILINVDFINKRLGTSLTSAQIRALLGFVNFVAGPAEAGNENLLLVTAPFWRTDIGLPEDIVEEIGRLHGFDSLPRVLPNRSSSPAKLNDVIATMQRVRNALSGAGANEVLTYSFVHERVLQRAGQDATQAYRLSNALSPDLQYYRLSLLPSLLDKVHANIKAGYDEYVLYEVGKAHHVGLLGDDNLPKELPRIAGVYAAKKQNNTYGAAYYTARSYVEQVAKSAGKQLELSFVPFAEYDTQSHDAFAQLCAPFEPKRSAVVFAGDKLAGVVGELKSSVRSGFKLPERVAAFELFLTPFVTQDTAISYTPLSRYPKVTQDISLRVDTQVAYAKMLKTCTQAIASETSEELQLQLAPVSIYEADNQTKTYTFRLTAVSYQKTLTDNEVSKWIQKIADAAREAVSAVQA